MLIVWPFGYRCGCQAHRMTQMPWQELDGLFGALQAVPDRRLTWPPSWIAAIPKTLKAALSVSKIARADGWA